MTILTKKKKLNIKTVNQSKIYQQLAQLPSNFLILSKAITKASMAEPEKKARVSH
jgi:hypothetical protein